jgi:CheY-like chemotaxis protein
MNAAQHGYSHGKEFCGPLESQGPDLPLMDIMLPRLSGREVARIIEHNRDLDDIPVLLMSAAPPKKAREEGTRPRLPPQAFQRADDARVGRGADRSTGHQLGG